MASLAANGLRRSSCHAFATHRAALDRFQAGGPTSGWAPSRQVPGMLGLAANLLVSPVGERRLDLDVGRLESRLGITMRPWPTTSHEGLVIRAISVRAPFDAEGSGHRDSLVWEDVGGRRLGSTGRPLPR